MKKLVFVLTMFLGTSFYVNAQNAVAVNDLPTDLRASFTKDFGTATDMSWTTSAGGYTSSFTMNNTRHYVEYDSNGKMTLHRQDLTDTQLPPTIASALKKDHPNHKVEEAEKITKDGVITYEVELEGKPDYEIIFDATGKILEKKVD